MRSSISDLRPSKKDYMTSEKVNIGDIIEWSFAGINYFAKVITIIDNDYCVHVVYEKIGLHQDYISEDQVISVYKEHKIQ